MMDSSLIRLLHNVRSVLTRTVELHPSERWPRLVLEKVITKVHDLEAGLPTDTNQQGEPVTIPQLLASRDHWRAVAEDAIADAEILDREIKRLRNIQASSDASPDDLRSKGWMVAVHNDYREHNGRRTFWLFTREDRAVKGEGDTDAEALNLIRQELVGDDRARHQCEYYGIGDTGCGATDTHAVELPTAPSGIRWLCSTHLAAIPDARAVDPLVLSILESQHIDRDLVEPAAPMANHEPPCDMCHPSHYGLQWDTIRGRFYDCTGPAHDLGPPREEPTPGY